MSTPKTNRYEFDEFELDLAKRRLLRNGENVPLKPKAFDLLAVLVENNGELVSKDDLFRLVWGDQFVEESSLSVGISSIRRAFGEKAAEPRYITNVSGRGYYFSAGLIDINGAEKAAGSNRRPSAEIAENDLPCEPSEIDPAIPAKMSGARSMRRYLVAGIALLVLVVGATIVYFVLYGANRSGNVPFQALSVNRLTTSGRAPVAAISPDGKIYAFDQFDQAGRNSLWVSHIDGSGQIQIRPPDDKPIASVMFSPDGGRIYFIQFETNMVGSGMLFRLPVFGGVIEKIRENVSNRIALSPNGKDFAFVRNDTAGNRSSLMIAAINGGEHELASMSLTEGSFSTATSWSPDGEFVAVVTNTSEPAAGRNKLMAVRVADGSVSEIANQGWESIRSIVWAKGAKGLLAAIGEGASDLERQIWYLPFPNGPAQKLLADSNAYASLDLSADGSVLLAVQSQTISNIWIAPASDLAAAKQVTFDMLGKQAGWNSIDWANDGRVLFSGRIGKTDTIWEMNPDGSSQRQIIPENGRSEYLSLPDDGSFVVFMSNRSGGSEIWRSNRDGSQLKMLTTGGYNENPHVSPDGSYIVYHSGGAVGSRLMRISSGGGNPVALTNDPSDWARFSPDSGMIAYCFRSNGEHKLAIMSVDGGPPQKTFDMPKTANVRLSVRWTPDGKSITYRDWLNGIWKQDINGGDPIRLDGLPAEKLFAYAWSRDGKQFAYARGTAISDVVLLTSLK